MERKLICPKCKSENLTSNQKGFSGGKALAGAVLTGGVGLLAGTIGSKDVLITCLNCGNKWKAGDVKETFVLETDETEKLDEITVSLWKEGKKMEALNHITTYTGLQKMQTLDYMKKLAAKNNIEIPKPKGCFGVILLPIGMIGGAAIAHFVYHII
jgi:hypothetical protein